jgi:hypothetical protein
MLYTTLQILLYFLFFTPHFYSPIFDTVSTAGGTDLTQVRHETRGRPDATALRIDLAQVQSYLDEVSTTCGSGWVNHRDHA